MRCELDLQIFLIENHTIHQMILKFLWMIHQERDNLLGGIRISEDFQSEITRSTTE